MSKKEEKKEETQEEKVMCEVCGKKDYKIRMFGCGNCGFVVCEMCLNALPKCPRCGYSPNANAIGWSDED